MDVKLNKESRTIIELMIADGIISREDAEKYFPELKSKDRRIRTEIINFLNAINKDTLEGRNLIADRYGDAIPDDMIPTWIAWLEKQEKKTWLSKDDEYTLARIIERLEDDECPSGWIDLLHDIYAMPYQKPIEWSEADENRFANLIFLVEASHEGTATKKGFIEFINRLKTYLAQPQWKPSEEQMNALKNAAKHFGGCDPDDWDATLESLYNDLKHLM